MPCWAPILFVAALVPPTSDPAPSPPTPQSAARVAVQSMLPPRLPSKLKRGEKAWLPSTFSLSRDPGFTPWSSFFSLGHDGIGRWTMEGTSLGGGLRCEDLSQRWCQPFAHAVAVLAWQPDGSPVAFFAGAEVVSIGKGDGMRTAMGFTGGVRFTPASLASLVKRVKTYAAALEH